MKISGKISVVETGYDGSRLSIFILDAKGNLMTGEFADNNGRFDLDIADRQLGPMRIIVCPPGATDWAKPLHALEREPGPELAHLEVRIPASAFTEAGIPTSFEFSVGRIRFSGGQQLEFSPRGLTLIVGANGAGKTRTLREIEAAVSSNGTYERKVTASIEFRPAFPEPWLFHGWLKSKFVVRSHGRRNYAEFSSYRLDIDNPPLNAESARFLVHYLGIEERLQLSRYHSFGGADAAPSNLLDHVFRDDKLLSAVAAATRSAFRQGLVEEFGPNIGFRIGERPVLASSDRVSGPYRIALQALPRLENGGDGIRSFVGSLLSLEACPHPIILIDEPEAFLHPPQARILGRRLAAAGGARQLFVATHSADIVLGALSARGSENIRIVRLDHALGDNNATSLDPASLTTLAKDPQWESTELIESMFYSGAVLCEADADRRFYRWLASEPELSFIACNGKGGIARAAAALRQLGVRVASIADFDVLSNEGELRTICAALGGDTDELLGKGSNYASIRSRLTTGARAKPLEEIRTELHDLAQGASSISDRGALVKQISELLEKSKAGYESKRHGLGSLSGAEHVACQRLLDQLASIGLFVVTGGELESWDRSLPANKSDWIAAAWDIARRDATAFGDARAFAAKVASYLIRETVDSSRDRP